MKKCILVFDDDTEILLVCKIILEQQNYRIETRVLCDNIIEDVHLVKPDMILMDLWIPEIGGENAIKLVKENEATQHIPVILFSANAEIAAISKRVSADGFLSKPFEIASLLQIIENNILEIS
jgi:two-component system cell cycle response regulator DivK